MLTRRNVLVASLVSLAGCARTPALPPPVQVAPKPEPSAQRQCSMTLHAASEFSDEAREIILKAANIWRDLSEGQIDIRVVFDLTPEWFRIGKAESYSLLVPILSDSPIARQLDKDLGGPDAVPAAATVSFESGKKHVFIIIDRVMDDEVLHTVAHELGHVAGMPDLPVWFGSIMAGVSFPGVAEAEDPSEYDRALCVAARYCKK